MKRTNTRGRHGQSITVGFSIAEADQPRLEHLVEVFGEGNRSAFLRAAMKQMEVLERAQRLGRLQAYGAQRSAARGIQPGDVDAIVKRVLARRTNV